MFSDIFLLRNNQQGTLVDIGITKNPYPVTVDVREVEIAAILTKKSIGFELVGNISLFIERKLIDSIRLWSGYISSLVKFV